MFHEVYDFDSWLERRNAFNEQRNDIRVIITADGQFGSVYRLFCDESVSVTSIENTPHLQHRLGRVFRCKQKS